MKKIILASASTRRKMLLKQIGLDFKSVISDFIEKIDTTINPHKLAKQLSFGKAKSVAKKNEKRNHYCCGYICSVSRKDYWKSKRRT